jgi:hypothetical protein
MRFLAREAALDILGDENCVRVLGDLYLCGLDYLLVKRIVIASIADEVFGFVGDHIPILNINCGRYLLYYGIPRILFSDRLVVPGWKIVESRDSVIVYDCFDDVMEFFEVESFIFYKVPLSMFGFGLAELYNRLIDLLRTKSLYMLKYLY